MSNDPGREDIEKVRAILEGKNRLAFIAEALESKAGREFLRGYMEYLAVNTLAFQYDTFPGACAVFAPAINDGNSGEVKRLVMICVTEPSMVEDVLRAVQPVLDGGIAVDMTDGTTSDFASVVESIVGHKEEGTDTDTDSEEDGEWL